MFCPECGEIVAPGPLDVRAAMAEHSPDPVTCRQTEWQRSRDSEPVDRIVITSDGCSIDAKLIASGLALDASSILPMMKAGEITSICESGGDEDQGLNRLTFCHGTDRVRIVSDVSGRVSAVERL